MLGEVLFYLFILVCAVVVYRWLRGKSQWSSNPRPVNDQEWCLAFCYEALTRDKVDLRTYEVMVEQVLSGVARSVEHWQGDRNIQFEIDDQDFHIRVAVHEDKFKWKGPIRGYTYD